jgi:hypothetical protein
MAEPCTLDFLSSFLERKYQSVLNPGAVEDILVPAGQFRCRKMVMEVLGGKVIFWIAVTTPYHLVKYHDEKTSTTFLLTGR